MRFDDLTPDEVIGIARDNRDRPYIRKTIGVDETTRWEITRHRIGSDKATQVARCYQRPDGKWVLWVSGAWVQPDQCNTPDGRAWEYVSETYEGIYQTMRNRGQSHPDGYLLCPWLPNEGWCKNTRLVQVV